jgi:hypothetical protein
MSELRIIRRETVPSFDWRRAYRIYVDGVLAGQVGHGRETTVRVAPGRHTVQLRIDFAHSPRRTVDIAEGQTVTLSCHEQPPPMNLAYTLIRQGDYIFWDD